MDHCNTQDFGQKIIHSTENFDFCFSYVAESHGEVMMALAFFKHYFAV